MDTRTEAETPAEAGERSRLALLAGVLAALGLARVAGRLVGLVALLGTVLASVGALTLGILLLRLLLLR